jgi:hypothetical protein
MRCSGPSTVDSTDVLSYRMYTMKRHDFITQSTVKRPDFGDILNIGKLFFRC